MTKDNAEKLLLAFSLATTAGDTAVADLLESVILEVMVDANQPPITIGGNKATLEPPWNVACGPDIVPLSGEKLDMVTIGATDEIRPSWCTKDPIVVNTADAVRDWDDDE